jgi:hypothetical protein
MTVGLDTRLITNGLLGNAIDVSVKEILQADKAASRAAIGAEANADLGALATLNSVPNTKLDGGFAKHALVAGGAAGDIAVAAIKTGDELNEVIQYIGAGTAVTDVVDLTAEFSIKAGNGVINNTGGTNTTGSKLMVRWTKKTA